MIDFRGVFVVRFCAQFGSDPPPPPPRRAEKRHALRVRLAHQFRRRRRLWSFPAGSTEPPSPGNRPAHSSRAAPPATASQTGGKAGGGGGPRCPQARGRVSVRSRGLRTVLRVIPTTSEPSKAALKK